MNEKRNLESGESLYSEKMDQSGFDAWIVQYLLGLGEFEVDNFGGESQLQLWILFLIATFLIQITFLNVLIAVMANTFDMVQEQTNEAAMHEKINILNDYRWVNKLFKIDSKFEYIFIVKPITAGAGIHS